MRNPTPQSAAFFAALIISNISFFICIYLQLSWYETGMLLGTEFIVAFVAAYFIMQYFIYRKIKLIYKSIHSQKLGGENFEKNPLLNLDPIGEAMNEVSKWEESKTMEVAEMEAREEFRREFVGNVSHELKTPLFNIQGYIHTLLDGAIDDTAVNKNFLDKASRNVDRLVSLVQDLETISKLEGGSFKPSTENFNITDLIKEVCESLEMKAGKRHISLSIKKGCDEPFPVNADKDLIRQVLVNLLDNSIKYGSDGGNSIFSIYDMGENILVELSDDGIGVDEEHLPRLFERFYRVDKHRSREQGGTGLGLAIVKHMIEAHQQTINVRSRIGAGTTFGFTLRKV